MWIYIVAPFIGAILAAGWQRIDTYAIAKFEASKAALENEGKPLDESVPSPRASNANKSNLSLINQNS